jgi:general secretion pathway protein A
MYEPYYGFTEKPFNLTPDPKYLYLSRRHSEAFAHLEFGRRERGGFVLITGEVGTGKTTTARYFLSKLPEGTATAVVLYPALTAVELLKTIADDLHAPSTGASLKELVDALHRFLLQSRAQGREVVLLIDEAQDLSIEVLEQIRLISNLETDTDKLIQIILMGQTELQDMLARRELRQLAQRVTARYHLTALSKPETEEYVRHRLTVAGGAGKVTFTPAALTAVHRHAYGVPRLINLICDRSLLAGYVKGTRVIHAGMVGEAAEEARGELPRRMSPRGIALLGTGVVGTAALAFMLVAPRTLHAPAVETAPLEAAPRAPALPRAPEPTPSPANAADAPSPAPVAQATSSPSPAPMAYAAPSASPALAGAAERLDALVLNAPRESSFRSAVDNVGALWRSEPLEQTALRTHLEQLRRFDLPVVLEMFHPARRDTCFLALLRLEDDAASVTVGDSAPLRVPVAALDRLWTRDAIFLWRDFDAVLPDKTKAVAWARENLARLGYAEQDLHGAVGRFQRDSLLVSDGVIGKRTLMTLYSLGPYPRPHLASSVKPGDAS